MCQMKSNSNTNSIYPLGLVDRNQKIIPTYSRTIKARRSYTPSTTSAASPDPISFTAPNDTATENFSTEFTWTSHSQINSQINCDYFLNWDENKQSDLCDKKITILNMDQSSCILTSSRGRFHYNNEHRMESTQFSSNDKQNKKNTQHIKMISGTHNKHVHRHRTARKMGNTKASDCFVVVVCLLILVVHQVFAKPIDNQGSRTSMDHSLEEALRSPCREEKIPSQEDHNEVNIKGILQVIKRQSAIAKSIARQDIAQYLKITEDTSVEDFHYRWRIMEQGWLYPRGKLTKEFGESIPDAEGEHFRAPARKFNIEAMKKLLIERLSKLLQECDERFQLLVIGFHNVLDDHNTKRSTMDLEKYNPLYEVFARAKSNTQMVLCEIRTALHKLGAPIAVLNPHNIRSSKAPNSSFYDWVVFREYINQLEHINEVVNIILENI